ncbi:MAG: alpha/beta hydrolase [Gammaproteobacteria bacterium]|nr:alpha/beta hydrolase [Gammaproteobacteria bacterium]
MNECVILLHGLNRNARSLSEIEQALTKAGFVTVNQDYPSTRYCIEKLSQDTITRALLKCPKGGKVHFVTHSMGGILVRDYLHRYAIKNMGRVVMLGPPNKGSEVVDKLRRYPGFKILNGPAGMQLGTKEKSVPKRLGSVNFETGIIAGAHSINPILSTMLPKPNDGKVSVENTMINGMSDHLILPVTHPFMMNNRVVIEQSIHFLKQGGFKK